MCWRVGGSRVAGGLGARLLLLLLLRPPHLCPGEGRKEIVYIAYWLELWISEGGVIETELNQN